MLTEPGEDRISFHAEKGCLSLREGQGIPSDTTAEIRHHLEAFIPASPIRSDLEGRGLLKAFLGE